MECRIVAQVGDIWVGGPSGRRRLSAKEHKETYTGVQISPYPLTKIKNNYYGIGDKNLDHKELGKQLNLFCFSDAVGKGLPLWLPNGAIIREELISYLKKIQLKMGYKGVVSPHIANKKLYQISGHYDKYKDHSFGEMCCDDESYLIKPMNCPHHCEMFKSQPRSYKELPLRYAEFGQVYRYEDSGALNGLLRVRSFCVDDSHMFCMPEQVKDEISNVIKLVLQVFGKFNFKEYKAQISLRDKSNKEKYIGSDEVWENAENALIEVAKANNLNIQIEEGEAAFYGPKIDFIVKDSLNREWQLGTVQLDYNLPEKFELEYIDSDGKLKRPVMIHRAPFGSLERFIAIILEQFQGKLPVWLMPEQVRVLPISDKFKGYAEDINSKLLDIDIRSSVDNRSESLSRKIKDSQLNYLPYIIIIGEQEVKSEILAIRGRNGMYKLCLDEFIKMIKNDNL